MERDEPKPGERWRHFKGGEYWVTAIAYGITSSGKLLPEKKFVIYTKSSSLVTPNKPIYHTETNDVFYIAESDINTEEKFFPLSLSNVRRTSRSATTEQTLWARPINSFMGVVSSPHGAEASNCYRFERIP